MRGEDLAVVVPAYRTAATLEELYVRLDEVLASRGCAVRFVFVDDASPDADRAVLHRLAADDPRIDVVALDQNVGQQRATMIGLARAAATVVAVMDADLQDPPEALPQLLDELASGSFEAVFAGRRGHYESAGRLATSRVFKWLVHRLTGVPRDAGSYVVMTRRMVDAVSRLDARRPYLVGMIGATRLPTASVPVERLPRRAGESAYNGRTRLAMALPAIWQLLTTWRRA